MPIAIRIKRGTGAPPTTLLRGELAFYEDEQKLYIGKGDSGSYDPNGLPIATSVVELTTPPTVLEDLANISVGIGASNGDVLVYDSATTEWVSQALSIAWDDVASKPSFATVATTGAYSDLSGTPTLGTAASAATGDFVASSSVSLFGASLIDDTSAADARTTLGLGSAATLASTAFADADHEHAWSDITSGVPATFAPSAHNHTVTLEISGFIESPEAKTYVISPAIPEAITITQLKAQTSAGTVDLAVHDDGTQVTGCSLADAGTTLASLASAISESVAAGSKLALVVSDLQSSPADLAFTIHYTVASANNT